MRGFLFECEKTNPDGLFTQEPVESTPEIGYAATDRAVSNLYLKEGGNVAMRKRKIAAGIVLAVVVLFALLSIPAPDPVIAQGAAGQPFLWKQDATWNALEASFRRQGRSAAGGLNPASTGTSAQARKYLSTLAASPVQAGRTGPHKDGNIIFGLGTMVAACPERLLDYIDLVTKTRSLAKRQSESWDMNDRAVRDRLYRLIYGGRAALEEVMLQAPGGSFPALIKGDDVSSVTPSYVFQAGPSTAGISSYREAAHRRRP